MRRTYEIGAEPRGHTYNDLLYRSFPWCAELLLVVVPLAGGADPLLPGGRAVLEELAPFLRTVTDEREWPGTRLEGGATGRVHRYTLHPEVLDVLARATDRLYGWTPPSLPQDIALIRGDGEPFLATVTLEAWASLSLEPEEHAQLASDLPELALRDLWG
ncbi:MAG TPA: hypothetical protein VFM93_11730 [Candidatus Limnocylindria bacterium]|nr:hypothetical protein [Candidatus Limnocylindria bacterium]